VETLFFLGDSVVWLVSVECEAGLAHVVIVVARVALASLAVVHEEGIEVVCWFVGLWPISIWLPDAWPFCWGEGDCVFEPCSGIPWLFWPVS
jgi:hypothetical protein